MQYWSTFSLFFIVSKAHPDRRPFPLAPPGARLSSKNWMRITYGKVGQVGAFLTVWRITVQYTVQNSTIVVEMGVSGLGKLVGKVP